MNSSGSITTHDSLNLSWTNRIAKRFFDLVVGLIGLVVVSPLIAAGWLAATISTHENGFFMQARVGRYGKLFRVIKLRTMRDHHEVFTTVTTECDPRITRVGRFLRAAKLDELPQLINVVLGQMSLVGPRPDVPGFADQLAGEARAILNLRPGITGPATLEFLNEQELLAAQPDPVSYNRDVIWPRKVELNLEYLRHYTFWRDLAYIWRTICG